MMTYHTKRTFLFVLLTLLLTGSANAQTHEAVGLKDVYRNYFTIGGGKPAQCDRPHTNGVDQKRV